MISYAESDPKHMWANLLVGKIVHAELAPSLALNRTPLVGAFYAESAPFCALNRPPPKPVRFAFKVYL